MSETFEQSERSVDALATILSEVDHRPASYLSGARKLAQLGAHPNLLPIRVAVLSTFTFEPVLPYLRVEGARRGVGVHALALPYGQLEQQVLEPGSDLFHFSPDVVIIAARIEDCARQLVDGFVALTAESIEHAVDAYIERVASLVRAIRERRPVHVVIWNQAPLARLAAGIADTSLDASQQGMVAELNQRLALAVIAAGATVFDIARIATEIGTVNYYDGKLEVLARIPLSGTAQIAIGGGLARHLRAIVRSPCKCLVVDLDNTLWGGVLGEDGVRGIAIGEEHIGLAFKAFQSAIHGYRDRGILLAVASKNNEPDVIEAFKTHPSMVLKWEDFAASQVHWGDKATSLRAIAEELNIGVDALVFFDDNPVERGWVRSRLPEVTVIDVPKDPLQFTKALDACGAFDQLALTTEDRKRSELYQTEAHRRALQSATGSVEEFLRALDMKVIIGDVAEPTLPRVVQLLAKTNQFNMTTRRYSEPDLRALLARDGTIALWMSVSDRYGDNGLVGVAIAVREEPEAYRLDNFLLSCRVLGRQVERALLCEVAARVVADGGRTLIGELIPTKKNAPAMNFFAETGFSQFLDRDNLWQLSLSNGPPSPPTAFEITRGVA
jgi:FkbH-like protein